MPKKSNNFDIVVVGAGIAGCLFSRDLAREGYKICLIEQKARSELGHTWWDSVSKSIFDTVGLAHPTKDELFTRGDMFICSPQESVYVMVRDKGQKYQLDRRKFAQRLITETLAAGTELRDKTTVTGPVVDEATQTVVGVTVKDGDPVLARLTADCSGYHGVLRSKLPFPTDFMKEIPRTDTFLTYREIRPKKPTTAENYWLYRFGQYKGVMWVSFNQAELVDFFGGRIDLPNETITAKAMTQQLIDEYGHLCEPEIVMGGYGEPIPVGAAMDSFVANGFMMIGDAAKQCHPLNGSGIASSLWSAHLAAQTASEVLKNSDAVATKQALWPYNLSYHRSGINLTFAFLNVLQKNLVTLSEDEIEYLFRKNIVNFGGLSSGDVTSSGSGSGGSGSSASGLLGTLKLLIKGMDNLDLLLRLKDAMSNAKRIKEVYLDYPETYSAEALKHWQDAIRACYPGDPKR